MLILHSANIKLAQEIAHNLNTNYKYYTNFSILDIDNNLLKTNNLEQIRTKYKVDINNYPDFFDFSQAKLFVSDMDSTIINIECVDEMAKIAGVGDEVGAITDAAMTTNIDFNTSLTKRLALLAGMSVDGLAQVYNDSLKINDGAVELIKFLNKNNIHSALVSGGFNFFAKKVAKLLVMDNYLANELEVIDNKLTGKVLGVIVNGEQKSLFIDRLVKKYQTNPRNTIAIGDGSNDLAMMQKSGLSIAYRAKKIVRDYADVIIDYSPLDVIIDFFIYKNL